ncbi:hypothetical protein ACTJJT_26675, partial [Pseudomonas sp. 22373]|uniref:hypothetical protein n=1 Tax=Pseudomonas sp. 22373 TaxID=3453914 RepID=UPI003F87ED06
DAPLPPYPQGHTAWHDIAQWPGVFAVGFMVLQISRAARAAHRELRSLLRLFLANNACGRRARPFVCTTQYRAKRQGVRAQIPQK